MQCASHKNRLTLQIYFEYSTTVTPHPSVQIYPECTVCVRKYENGTVLPKHYLFSVSMRQQQLQVQQTHIIFECNSQQNITAIITDCYLVLFFFTSTIVISELQFEENLAEQVS